MKSEEKEPVNCIWYTPNGDCGPARVPEANKLVPCNPCGCSYYEEKTKSKGHGRKI